MLEIQSINTYYGESHILQGVDLQIKKGQAVGLLGRNGMGKTTLIRSLMGYVPAASGNILWNGKDVTGLAPERMARFGIGYVPEGRGIFPNLSVRENLIMSARRGVDGRNDWTYERVLDTFPRIKQRLDHGGQQLSGGEQQMVAIGRALMTNPELMVLDEATEGLAPLIVMEIWRIIREIGASGISTLIVDRNFREVLAQTDRAFVMEKGRIVLTGDSAGLAESQAELMQYLGV